MLGKINSALSGGVTAKRRAATDRLSDIRVVMAAGKIYQYTDNLKIEYKSAATREVFLRTKGPYAHAGADCPIFVRVNTILKQSFHL